MSGRSVSFLSQNGWFTTPIGQSLSTGIIGTLNRDQWTGKVHRMCGSPRVVRYFVGMGTGTLEIID